MAEKDKDAVQVVMEAFNEFKRVNNENQTKHRSDLDAKLDKINATLDKYEPLNQQITLMAQQQKAMQEQVDNAVKILNRPGGLGGNPEAEEQKAYRAAFERVMRLPSDRRDPADLAIISKRVAALTTASDTGAGYLLAPAEMQTEIIKNIVEQSPMRTLVTVRTIGSGSLKGPKRTGTGSASRTGEKQHRTNTGDPAYGMIDIHAPEMFARIEVSQQMLEDSEYDLMGELKDDASEQFAVREGREHISGKAAANECEGILVNADVGYTPSGDANLIKADGLIDLYYGIKTGYARNGVFTLNRKTIGAVRKLKDSQNQYLWQPGIAGNVPNTIIGSPYVEMPDMPDVAANAFPVAFGDFRRAYVIVDRIAISFQTDFTTGADDGLVVFRARKRTGGGVRQAEAIRKLKIATS